MQQRTSMALWTQLDQILAWAARVDDTLLEVLLEDNLIADAHSHPKRSDFDDTQQAIQRCWKVIRAYAAPTEDVVHD